MCGVVANSVGCAGVGCAGALGVVACGEGEWCGVAYEGAVRRMVGSSCRK